MKHCCDSCNAKPYQGHIACPIAATIINRDRCKRVRAMNAAKAQSNLALLWLRKYTIAKRDRRVTVVKFMVWASKHTDRLHEIMRNLSPSVQIDTFISPVIRRRIVSYKDDQASE